MRDGRYRRNYGNRGGRLRRRKRLRRLIKDRGPLLRRARLDSGLRRARLDSGLRRARLNLGRARRGRARRLVEPAFPSDVLGGRFHRRLRSREARRGPCLGSDVRGSRRRNRLRARRSRCRRAAGPRFIEEPIQHHLPHLAHTVPVAPEGSGAEQQDCRGRDPSGAVPLRYAVEGRKSPLRIFRRSGVRDVFFPFLVYLVLIAFIEELSRQRMITRVVGKDPLRAFDPLGALDRSRMASP